MSFGERVIEALDLKGMTREELYVATGLKSSYLVGYLKNPDRSPQLSTACKIALALDVSLDYLGGLIDEPRPLQRDADGNIVVPELSKPEEELLGLYRDSNSQGQATIIGVARLQPGMEGPSAPSEVRGA